MIFGKWSPWFLKSGIFTDRLVVRILQSAWWVRAFVCLFASVSPKLHVRSRPTPIFWFMLPMAVARYSSGSVAIRYVLPVLRMTSFLHTTATRKSRILKVTQKGSARIWHRGLNSSWTTGRQHRNVASTTALSSNAWRTSEGQRQQSRTLYTW